MTEFDQDGWPTKPAIHPDQSPELGELFAALAKAQGMMTGAKKDSANPFFKSKYADLHQVWEAVREPLSANILSVIQTTRRTENGLEIVTTLGHGSGQWMRSYTPVKAMKDDPQAMGSAITYARRYALAAICGVAQMDDDGESAMNRGAVIPDPVDTNKVKKAAAFFREKLDEDQLDENYEMIQVAYHKLSNDEKLAVDTELSVTAPDSKRLYRTILKDYLKYKGPTDENLQHTL